MSGALQTWLVQARDLRDRRASAATYAAIGQHWTDLDDRAIDAAGPDQLLAFLDLIGDSGNVAWSKPIRGCRGGTAWERRNMAARNALQRLEQRMNEGMTPRQIRAAREQLGLTLAELATLLGYKGKHARQEVHRLETGRRDLPEAQRLLIEAYLAGYRPPNWPGHDSPDPGKIRGPGSDAGD